LSLLAGLPASAGAASNGRLTISDQTGVFSVGPTGRALGRERGTGRDDLNARWSPDGRVLGFQRGRDVWVRTPGGAATPVKIPDQAGAPCGAGFTGALLEGWHPDGRVLVSGWAPDAPGGRCSASPWLVDWASGRAERLAPPWSCDRLLSPALSPDGRSLAFWDPCAGDMYVTTVSPWAPRRVTRLTWTEQPGFGPRVGTVEWAPDGRRIAFAIGEDEEDPDLHVVRVDGRGAWAVPSASGPSWSPDGNTIAYAVHRRTVSIITLASPAGGRRRGIARRGERPEWSPDGRFIAFAAHAPFERGGTYAGTDRVRRSGTGRRRLSRRVAYHLDWQPRAG
jgi:Tol biopolymer transport system component